MTKQEMINCIYEKIADMIIGHPVMIGDVLQYYNNLPHAEIYTDNTGVIINLFKDKLHLPVDEQSDECIKFIYQLIQ